MRRIINTLFTLSDLGIAGLIILSYLIHAYPVFTGLGKLKVENFTQSEITISAEAKLYNPNRASCTLKRMDLDVFANGREVGNVSQGLSSVINGKSAFTLPLRISFSPAKIFNPRDLIGNLLSTFSTQKLDLRFTGSIQVDLSGISLSIPVDYSETLPIKLKR